MIHKAVSSVKRKNIVLILLTTSQCSCIMNMQDEYSHYNGKKERKMKIDKDRMLWGESLEMIAAYVADTLHIGDLNISVKSMGIRKPIPYEYTFTVNGAKVSMYSRSGYPNTNGIFVKTSDSVEFSCETFGEVVDNILWLAECEEVG